MTKETFINLLDQYAEQVKVYKTRIKTLKEIYFKDRYRFKEGDRISVLHKVLDKSFVAFFRYAEITDDGDIAMSIQEIDKEGKPGTIFSIWEKDCISIEKIEDYEKI